MSLRRAIIPDDDLLLFLPPLLAKQLKFLEWQSFRSSQSILARQMGSTEFLQETDGIFHLYQICKAECSTTLQEISFPWDIFMSQSFDLGICYFFDMAKPSWDSFSTIIWYKYVKIFSCSKHAQVKRSQWLCENTPYAAMVHLVLFLPYKGAFKQHISQANNLITNISLWWICFIKNIIRTSTKTCYFRKRIFTLTWIA